jgi:NAD(P)-dependent dehydrogenase (short-subunit alcohol dehydrogenase family)
MNVTYNFGGKVVVVTGAGSGIGKATALLMGESKAKVLVSDISDDGGLDTVNLIKKSGGEAAFYHANVSNKEQVTGMVAEAVKLYGRIDYAANVAGVFNDATFGFTEIPDSEYFRVMDANLKGLFYCMQAELKSMLSQGGEGYSIVNVASVQGLVAIARGSVYSTSKHGVVGITKAVALEYALKGIRVNAVCPGTADTPLLRKTFASRGIEMPKDWPRIPMNRLCTPEESAHAVAWLLSEGSSYVTGATLAVDGALTAQ